MPCSSSAAGTSSSACFTSFAYATTPPRRTSLAPGIPVSREATRPPVQDSAVAECQAAGRAEAEHVRLDRLLVAGVEPALDWRQEPGVEIVGARVRAGLDATRSTWISKSRAQIVASTPSPSPPAS